MNAKWLFSLVLVLTFLCLLIPTAKAENPTNVEVGVWLVNVEKVDLASNSYNWTFICGLGSTPQR